MIRCILLSLCSICFILESVEGNNSTPFSLEETFECSDHLLNQEQRGIVGSPKKEGLIKLLDIANIQKNNDVPSEYVINSFKKAYQYSPTSIEPLYFLAKYYLNNNRPIEAYSSIKKAMEVLEADLSNRIVLFPWLYQYGVYWEYGRMAYEVGEFETAVLTAHYLLDHVLLSEDRIKTLKSNLVLYVRGLEVSNFAKEHWGPAPWETTQ